MEPSKNRDQRPEHPVLGAKSFADNFLVDRTSRCCLGENLPLKSGNSNFIGYPGIGEEPGFETSLTEELFSIKSFLDCNLWKKQASTF